MSSDEAAVNPRRRNMQANRRRDTSPEVLVRRRLHQQGLRYRCDFRIDLPHSKVRPDIVFTRARVAVFIDGCFWHSCPIHGREPRTNSTYWLPKLKRTRERDGQNSLALLQAGWDVVRAWEHEDPEEVATRIARVVQTRR